MTKLLLIDGSSLAFRAFYGLNDLVKFKTKTGFHTNALYAFHTMLDAIVKREEPTHILVAFDAGKTTFRTEKYADYKGGRSSMPAELAEQWPYFKIMLDGLGMSHYDLINYEADDIIGTLANHMSTSGNDVVIVTGDKDMLQLVDSHVRVDIIKKGAEVVQYTVQSIQDDMGITPKQIIDVKGLMGDKSDNYPGVTKVGEKTALKLIQEFESIDGVYDNLDTMKQSKLKENLQQDKELAYLSKELATIITNAPIEVTLDDTLYKGKQHEQLISFYEKMEFNQFLNQLDIVQQVDVPNEEVAYEYVTKMTSDMFNNNAQLYIESLYDNYHMNSPLAIGWKINDKIYIAEWETVISSPDFKEWCQSQHKKELFDSKEATVLLAQHGIVLNNIANDLSIMAYIVNADSKLNLSDLAQQYSMNTTLIADENIYGKGAKMAIPEQSIWASHVANKVAIMSELILQLQTKLKDNDQLDLYHNIELPLACVLARLEIEGIVVDKRVFVSMGENLQERLKVLEQDIYELAGETFNIASPKQLGDVLFNKMGLPASKKTKTGYSTAVDVLEKLAGYPIVSKILDYRQIAKLNSTYVDGLQKYILPDGKIHTRFVQTLTQTGRLSSTDPNLQNIPIRLEEGRLIRKAFLPVEDTHVLLSADYSQIELRVLAHIAKDEHMTEAFLNGEDIHTSTAMRVFGVSKDDVTSDMRRQAKAVNFGIVYGISDYGLSQNLNITRKDAQQFIDTYFEKYPNIKQYMEDIVLFAREKGYVDTLFNRRRYLPDIKSSNFNIRSFAERTAMNTPIQGSAADIIKIAMVKLQQHLQENKLQAKILLQVHDELVLDVPKNELEQVKQLVKDTMESAITMNVPLKVDTAYGKTWYDCK